MSLINQMLRDLESRSTTNNEPSILQHNVRVMRPPASKMRFWLWGLLSIIAIGGTGWAYQYSNTLVKTAPVSVADNIKKDPLPVAPYEKVLAAPNAIAHAAPKIEPKVAENTATQAAPVVQPTPAVQAAAAQPKLPAKPVETAPVVQAAVETVTEAPVKKMPLVSKSAAVNAGTAKQRADQLYHQAENNFDSYSAVYKLEQALALDPRHLKARLLLAKTLHNQGQVNKTAEFLDQSLALFPDNLQFINTRAQLYLQQRNPGGALKTLKGIDLTDSSNETYLSLLAATYQQLQSFNNAANVYQRLVTVNPEKAENWLGLALAQEKLGNSRFARESYQQALSRNTLKESIVSYIKLRLIELR